MDIYAFQRDFLKGVYQRQVGMNTISKFSNYLQLIFKRKIEIHKEDCFRGVFSDYREQLHRSSKSYLPCLLSFRISVDSFEEHRLFSQF